MRKNLHTLHAIAFTDNYGKYYVTNAIANEMHDLFTHAKFPDAHFQLLLSKIVAEVQLVYRKMKNKLSEMNFFHFRQHLEVKL